MTTIVGNNICAGYEPIPGYVLEEPIGRGGFGEVWRASAPGGLKKAVKFVFGGAGSERSLRERRSLERIRGVQHPFLLTLERFETIENQLVIVTELADGSLEDIFKNHCHNGSCGIPRESLLRHLHDTADALDYLHDHYQLQHLDIKPANLLMVGGHVKVADFGLLKDLREGECSMVGGLTPVYAPPELFDGRPSIHSDQYSLAVMYQELLTGVRPFHGRSIAQLATQHVHNAPNLEPLPPADRPAVARVPWKRILIDVTIAVVRSSNHSGIRDPASRMPSATLQRATPGEFDHIGSVEDLPQLESGRLETGSPDDSQLKQEFALVVALGGTGADCIRWLRRRAAEKHNEHLLGLHSVLIDTDVATLDSIRDTDLGTAAGPCDLVYTPLRTAKEYRANGTERLRTISRRWIYNVPRSGTTEGMRPLGRLALVDHGTVVNERLSTVIGQLINAAGDQTPRVYVVGSLAGGTSSGMYLDVVHLLRDLLDQAGLEQASILSLLSTAPIQADPGYPLGLYDTHAALIEMNHFLDASNGYPGDPGAGWPSVPAARTPLHDVYVVVEPTTGSLSPSPVESICDYIWSNSTGAGDLLTAARKRQASDEHSWTGPTLHSVGVVPLADSNRVQEKVLSPAVARELLVRWLGLPSQAREAALSFRDRIVRRIGISASAMVNEVADRLTKLSDQMLVADAKLELADRPTDDWSQAMKRLHPIVAKIREDDSVKSICSDVMTKFFGQISGALTDQTADLTTTIECIKLIQQANADSVKDLYSELENRWHTKEAVVADDVLCRIVAAENLAHLNECLQFLLQRFDRFATTLAMGVVQATKLQGVETNPWDAMPPDHRSQFMVAVDRLHQSTVNHFLVRTLVDHGVNIDALAMVNHLHDAAIGIVESIITPSVVQQLADDAEGDSAANLETDEIRPTDLTPSEPITKTVVPRQIRELRQGAEPLTVDEAIVAANPSLLQFGGQQRLILIVGTEREREQYEAQVRNAHTGSVSVVVIPGIAPTLIHEARAIELSSVLARLEMLNGENAQITGRLASRTDISW